MSLQYICRTAISNAHDYSIYSIKKIPNKRQLLSVSLDSTIRVWDLNGNPVTILKGHTLGVTSVDCDAKGTRAISTSIDSTLKLWDLNNHTLLNSIQLKPVQAWKASWSPNSSLIATSSMTGYVHIFDADNLSQKPVTSLPSKGKFGMVVRWSPDGRYIALGTDAGAVHLFDAEKSILLHTYSSHAGSPVRTIAFMGSSETPLIVSGADDKRINVHDIRYGNHIAQFSGHEGWVLSVACAPGPYLGGTGVTGGDATGLILSGSTDKKVKIWDLGMHRCVSTMTEAQDQIWSVEWLEPNDRGVSPFVTAGEDQTIRIYHAGGM